MGGFAQAGLSILGASSKAAETNISVNLSNAMANANYKVEKSTYNAQELLSNQAYEYNLELQKMNNEIAATTAASDLFIQSINNQQRQKYQGDQINAISQARSSYIGQSITSSLSSQLQMAEQMGRTEAAAATAGISGNTVDLINKTQALQNAITQDQVARGNMAALYNFAQQRAGLESNTIASSYEGASFDYGAFDFGIISKDINIAPIKPTTTQYNVLGGYMSNLIGGNGGVGLINMYNGIANSLSTSSTSQTATKK